MYYGGFFVPLEYIIQTVTYCNDVRNFMSLLDILYNALGQNSQNTSLNFEYGVASDMTDLSNDPSDTNVENLSIQ